jgi:hypothetical protein
MLWGSAVSNRGVDPTVEQFAIMVQYEAGYNYCIGVQYGL